VFFIGAERIQPKGQKEAQAIDVNIFALDFIFHHGQF